MTVMHDWRFHYDNDPGYKNDMPRAMQPGPTGATAVNLDKIYTVKSNATRDLKKAIAKGELTATAEVVVVPAGYQIALPYVAPVKTPQAPALPGMTPLGLPAADPNPIAIDVFAEAAELAKAVEAKPAAAPQADKPDCGMLLTVALLTAKAWAQKGLMPDERVGVWVPFTSVHEAHNPHGLSKAQMPACTGNARKRGLIQIAGSWEVGVPGPKKIVVCLTAAGLDAARVARRGSN